MMLPGLKETGNEVLMLSGHRLSVWIDEAVWEVDGSDCSTLL